MNKKLIAILCCIMLTGCTTETKINKPKTIKEEKPVVLTVKPQTLPIIITNKTAN